MHSINGFYVIVELKRESCTRDINNLICFYTNAQMDIYQIQILFIKAGVFCDLANETWIINFISCKMFLILI